MYSYYSTWGISTCTCVNILCHCDMLKWKNHLCARKFRSFNKRRFWAHLPHSLLIEGNKLRSRNIIRGSYIHLIKWSKRNKYLRYWYNYWLSMTLFWKITTNFQIISVPLFLSLTILTYDVNLLVSEILCKPPGFWDIM